MIHVLPLLPSLYHAYYLFLTLVENDSSTSFIICSLCSLSILSKNIPYYANKTQRTERFPASGQVRVIYRQTKTPRDTESRQHPFKDHSTIESIRSLRLPSHLNALSLLFKQTFASMFIMVMNFYLVSVSYTKPSYKIILNLVFLQDTCLQFSLHLSYREVADKSSTGWGLHLH